MLAGKCVLLIEDHPESCFQLQAMIERRSGKAECAHTLQEGLIVERAARTNGQPFDCVVSDLGLPNVTYQDVVEALKQLRSLGIPVRAISGTGDPDAVAACASAGIPLILKGTHAEGIMESVLYALSENPRTGDGLQKLGTDIIDNRDQVREIPVHTSWFFLTWPRWAQVISSFGTMIGIMVTICTLAIATIRTIDAKAIARETAAQTAKEVNTNVNRNTQMILQQGANIRSLQDTRIAWGAELKQQGRTLRRVEDKIDSIENVLNKLSGLPQTPPRQPEPDDNNQDTTFTPPPSP